MGFLVSHVPMRVLKLIDYYALGLFTIFFLIYHCVMVFPLFQALRRRQIMLERDRQYTSKLAGMFETFIQGHHAVQHFKHRQT